MVECGHKIEEKAKAMQSEIKKNIQGNKSEGKKTGKGNELHPKLLIQHSYHLE